MEKSSCWAKKAFESGLLLCTKTKNVYWREYFRFKLITTLVYGSTTELKNAKESTLSNIYSYINDGDVSCEKEPHLNVSYKLLRLHTDLHYCQLGLIQRDRVNDSILKCKQAISSHPSIDQDPDFQLFQVHLFVLESMASLSSGDFNVGADLLKEMTNKMTLSFNVRKQNQNHEYLMDWLGTTATFSIGYLTASIVKRTYGDMNSVDLYVGKGLNLIDSRLKSIKERNASNVTLDSETLAYLCRCDFQNASKDLNRCIGLISSYRDVLFCHRFNVHVLISIYCYMIGEFQTAFQHLEVCIVHPESDNVRKWCDLFQMVSNVSSGQFSVDSIFSQLLHQMNTNNKFEEFGVHCAQLFLKSILCAKNHDQKGALQYLQECEKVLGNSFNNKQLMAQCKYVHGQLHRNDNLQRAYESFDASFVMCVEMNDLIGQFHSLSAMIQTDEQLQFKKVQEQRESVFEGEQNPSNESELFVGTPLTSSVMNQNHDLRMRFEKYKDLKKKIINNMNKNNPEHVLILSWLPNEDDEYVTK
ncbi:sec22 [Acrasis kona]|uniref:Sec22 n=1 Tax=Acrasis kona TaxID=1008807 RepID=A0AAW2Z545_9EUKA